MSYCPDCAQRDERINSLEEEISMLKADGREMEIDRQKRIIGIYEEALKQIEGHTQNMLCATVAKVARESLSKARKNLE